MSDHRPTAQLQGDVFEDGEQLTAEEVAKSFWDDVQDWVRTGYQPVVTVLMEDGTEVEVDLQTVEAS